MKDIQFFSPKTTPVFNPSEEAKIRRQKKMAEEMLKQSQQPQGTEMVSGMAVKQSPVAALARAIQGGLGSYTDRKADEASSEIEANRQKMLADAINAYGQNPAEAAQMLGQDPRTSEMAFKIMQGELSNKRDLEREGRSFARERQMLDLRNQYEQNSGQTAFERQQKMAEIENALAIARQNNNFDLEKQLIQEKNKIEQIQTQPRKLSATEQKELFEAQEKSAAGEGAIGALRQAQGIYERGQIDPSTGQLITGAQPYTGFGADLMTDVARIPVVGDIFADKERAAATTEAKNLVSMQALESLKSTFGGNPTEGERQILLQLQALPTYTPEEQRGIIKNALSAAERRKAFEAQKQYDIQTGGYAVPQLPNSNIPAQQIAVNPQTGERLINRGNGWEPYNGQ